MKETVDFPKHQKAIWGIINFPFVVSHLLIILGIELD